MSGAYRNRINRVWLNSTQANVAPFRFFFEVLNFINDHTGMSIIAYGTGATQTGTTVPSAWTSWDGIISPPYSNQDWFVFQADNASELLDGSGSYPWQAKVQVVNDSGTNFVDPSGVDYGLTTEDQIVAIRFSPNGGWDHAATNPDFSPASGADVCDNYACFYEDGIDFRCHFFGDDDTIHWFGIGGAGGNYTLSRGGYIGMIIPRDGNIDDPCICMIGRISDDTALDGRRATYAKKTTDYGQFYTVTSAVAAAPDHWPGFVLARDGTTGLTGYKLDAWGVYFPLAMGKYEYPTVNEDHVLSIMVAQWESPDNYSTIGELRYIFACDDTHGEGVVFGETQNFLQLSDSTSAANYGGICITWPDYEVPTI